MPKPVLDAIDRRILAALQEDARLTVQQIGDRVGLSASPCARRVRLLEAAGVIKGYVAVVDESVLDELDAFTEIRLTADTDTKQIEDIARQVPEVQQYFTIAGDTDALLRFRVRNVEHLQQVVNAIRRTGIVSYTKTLIVMSAWDRTRPPPRAPGRSGAGA